MVVDSVIVTGMGVIVRSSALLEMTRTDITLVIEQMAERSALSIGLGPSAKRIAKQ